MVHVNDNPMSDPRREQVVDLLALKADGQYRLSKINQRKHALPEAGLAERTGGSTSLVVASLLHDTEAMVQGVEIWTIRDQY
jgi:predicted HD phosphohydrolase